MTFRPPLVSLRRLGCGWAGKRLVRCAIVGTRGERLRSNQTNTPAPAAPDRWTIQTVPTRTSRFGEDRSPKAEVWVPSEPAISARCNGGPITRSELLASDGKCQKVLDSNNREEGDVNTQSSSVEVGPLD